MSHIKLMNIVGARPQFIKASAISREIRQNFSNRISEIIVHPGHHYDREMSDVFFDELEIHLPHYNLGVGSSRHGKQTSLMIAGIEDVLLKEKPDCIILYGDTNSTLAGAIAAAKLHFPVVHVEAGLRSFNKTMPEEINRIVSDHSSTLLFAPTDEALKNLLCEGFRPENTPPYTIDNPKVYLTGDIMYDNALHYSELAERKKSKFLEELKVERGEFVLATIHREINTDDKTRLETLMSTLITVAREESMTFVMPLHPRTILSLKTKLETLFRDLNNSGFIRIIPPVSYLEMILLEKNSRMIITDSGGVQKESHFFRKPCLVLRAETEWVELVHNGTAELVDADPVRIRKGFSRYLSEASELDYPAFYGDGKTAELILNEILLLFEKS